jgi:hypothetical protein
VKVVKGELIPASGVRVPVLRLFLYQDNAVQFEKNKRRQKQLTKTKIRTGAERKNENDKKNQNRTEVGTIQYIEFVLVSNY